MILNGHYDGAGKIPISSWKKYGKKLKQKFNIDSKQNLYEVGCGSGAFLYLFKDLKKIGGCDFSGNLIRYCRKFLPNHSKNILEKKSEEISISPKYDFVVSHGLLHYLNNISAKKTIIKMIKKSSNKIILLDIPEKKFKKKYLLLRKKALGETIYNNKYKNLNHNYYTKSFFSKIAKKEGCSYFFLKAILRNINKVNTDLMYVFQKINFYNNLFCFLSTLVFLFFLYEYSILNVNDFKTKFYLIFTFILILFFLTVSLLANDIKKKIFYFVLINIFSLYLIETFLNFYGKYDELNQIVDKYKLYEDRINTYNSLKEKLSKNVYFYIQNLASKKNLQKYPLSGIKNTHTIHCKENGYYSTYDSDRYGFNNPDEIWDISSHDVLLIGDCLFTELVFLENLPLQEILENIKAK